MVVDKISATTHITHYHIIEAATNKVILKTNTGRSGYIAVLISVDPSPSAQHRLLARFGREDLIGKGASKRMMGWPGVYLVRLIERIERS